MYRTVIALALGVTVSLLGGQVVLAGTVPAGKVSGKVATVPGSSSTVTVGSPTVSGGTGGTSGTLLDAANAKYTKYCPKDGGKEGRCPAPPPAPQQIVAAAPVVPSLQVQSGCPAGFPDCFSGATLIVVGFPPLTPVDITITTVAFPDPFTVPTPSATDANGMLIIPMPIFGPGLCPLTVTVTTTSGPVVTASTTVPVC